MLAPAPPLSAFQLRLELAELQLAALIVTLVAVPGVAAALEDEPHLAASGAEKAARSTGKRTSRGRHIRPPRSC
jgi:hypothetical protein